MLRAHVSSPVPWPQYLAAFHRRHAGITSQVLSRCRTTSGLDPYAWLAEAIPTGEPVLDLACGDAPLWTALAGRRYVGVDNSPAEQGAAADRGAGPLVRADATALPLATGTVGVLVCSMALMILTPLERVLAEARRVLAPAGRLVALVPAGGPVRLSRLPATVGLLALLGRRLGYPNDRPLHHPAAVLATVGLRLGRDEAVEFGYRLDSPAHADRLLASLYLPGLSPARYRAARRYLRMVAAPRATLPVPLRRIVADAI